LSLKLNSKSTGHFPALISAVCDTVNLPLSLKLSLVFCVTPFDPVFLPFLPTPLDLGDPWLSVFSIYY
jgi:hypothetical protein